MFQLFIQQRKLTDLIDQFEKSLCKLNSKLEKTKTTKAQLQHLMQLLKHILKRSDRAVVQDVWHKQIAGLSPGLKVTFELTEAKKTVSDLLYSLDILKDAKLVPEFIQDNRKEILTHKSILNGNISSFNNERSVSESFLQLAESYEKYFHLNKSDTDYKKLLFFTNQIQSIFVTCSYLHRQMLIFELAEKQHCGKEAQILISILMEDLFEIFNNYENRYEKIRTFSELTSKQEELSFYKDFNITFRKLFAKELRTVVDSFKNCSIDFESLQKLLFYVYEGQQIVEKYKEKLSNLPKYKQFADRFGEDLPGFDPDFLILRSLSDLLKVAFGVFDCIEILSLGQLSQSEKEIACYTSTIEHLKKFLDFKEESDSTKRGSLTGKNRAKNKRKKAAQQRRKLQQQKSTVASSEEPKTDEGKTPVPVDVQSTSAPTDDTAEKKVKINPPESVTLQKKESVRQNSKPLREEKKELAQTAESEKVANKNPFEEMSVRSIKFRELMKFISSAGWIKQRQKGSHIIMKHQTNPGTLVVPNHSTIKPGLAKDLVDQIIQRDR